MKLISVHKKEIPIVRNLFTKQPQGEITTSSQEMPLKKVYRKSKAIAKWDAEQTPFIFRPKSRLGTKWMSLLNGHIVHYAYDYFTYRHDRMERCRLTYPTPGCLRALHDPEVKPHLIEMGLGPVVLTSQT